MEDSGEGLTDSALDSLQRNVTAGAGEDSDSVALVNIHRRLQLHFGPGSGLAFERSPLGGLKVTVRIVPGEGRQISGTDPAGG